jgi:hypothetical protein
LLLNRNNGDLFRGTSFGDQLQHFALAAGQFVNPLVVTA